MVLSCIICLKETPMGKTHFNEEMAGFTPVLAMEEASRCLLCLDAPCSKCCPAGTDPAKFIRSIRFKNDKGAAKTIRLNNPLGGICARVCPTERYCQQGCSRSGIDKPIDIARLQAYATEVEDALGLRFLSKGEPNGKSVAIIGSGPGGLTAAAMLVQKGYSVVIYEKQARPGGYLRHGIPEYRLPTPVLNREIARIEELGVKIRCKEEVTDLEKLRKKYDAVLLGMGYAGAKMLPMFEGHSRVITAVDFLKKTKTRIGKLINHVLCIGGGDVAMDVCATCKKLGVAQVTDVVYETFDEFKASKAERELVQSLGVSIYDGFVPVSVGRGGVVTFKHRKYESTVKVKADLIILAIGQAYVPGQLGIKMKNGKLGALPEGVFAVGDLITEEKTVVHAVASGKRAAEEVDAYLGGK